VRRQAVLSMLQWRAILLDERAPVLVPSLTLLASSRLETGAVRSDGETSLVLAATGAPFWDCLKILEPEFPDRAVAHFDTFAHSALADTPYREQ
jgi:hypothetical protein